MRKVCRPLAVRQTTAWTMRRKCWRLLRTSIPTMTTGCSLTVLKLYLFSFRNHGDFHEDCVNIIMKDLVRLMEPKYIEVIGLFTPRGGISIYPYANYGQPGTKYADLAERRLMEYQMK